MKIKFNRTYEAVNTDGLTQVWPPDAVFDVPDKIAKKAIRAKAAVSMEPAPAKTATKAVKKAKVDPGQQTRTGLGGLVDRALGGRNKPEGGG